MTPELRDSQRNVIALLTAALDPDAADLVSAVVADMSNEERGMTLVAAMFEIKTLIETLALRFDVSVDEFRAQLPSAMGRFTDPPSDPGVP